MTPATLTASAPPAGGRSGIGYAPFIILCYARTGSNLLASALNTSPEIVCFRELFNPLMDDIGFRVDVEGYNDKSAEDRALRDHDFKDFLRERVFCDHNPDIKAVGFKMPFHHFWAFPGLLEHLAADNTDIRVLHLKRRNLLRVLVSERIAQATGGWADDKKRPLRSKFRASNIPGVLKHPLRSTHRFWRYLRPREAPWKHRRKPVTLDPDECRRFFAEQECESARYLQEFSGHPVLTVWYEDLVSDQTRALSDVQQFLRLRPRRLAPTTRKQNPEPLSELIENYDELIEAFRGTPEAAYFA